MWLHGTTSKKKVHQNVRCFSKSDPESLMRGLTMVPWQGLTCMGLLEVAVLGK